jgi:hypothetical protein
MSDHKIAPDYVYQASILKIHAKNWLLSSYLWLSELYVIPGIISRGNIHAALPLVWNDGLFDAVAKLVIEGVEDISPDIGSSYFADYFKEEYKKENLTVVTVIQNVKDWMLTRHEKYVPVYPSHKPCEYEYWFAIDQHYLNYDAVKEQ